MRRRKKDFPKDAKGDIESPILSIIVPVYNVEKYLRQCLDSLINQTLKDIEIIVVNDCSPDNSEAIVQEYMHDNFTTINFLIN